MREARFVRDEGVAGSNPATPTTLSRKPASSPDSFPDSIEQELARLYAFGTGVYVLKAARDDLLKVGVTRNLENRVSQIQGATGHLIRVLFFREYHDQARRVERDAHRLLRPWRERGEWYRAPLEVVTLAIDSADSGCTTARRFFELQAAKRRAQHHHQRVALEHQMFEECRDLWDLMPLSERIALTIGLVTFLGEQQ